MFRFRLQYRNDCAEVTISGVILSKRSSLLTISTIQIWTAVSTGNALPINILLPNSVGHTLCTIRVPHTVLNNGGYINLHAIVSEMQLIISKQLFFARLSFSFSEDKQPQDVPFPMITQIQLCIKIPVRVDLCSGEVSHLTLAGAIITLVEILMIYDQALASACGKWKLPVHVWSKFP